MHRNVMEFSKIILFLIGASLVAQIVKNMPEMQGTQVQSLGQGNYLEKRMAIHSRVLVWRNSHCNIPCWSAGEDVWILMAKLCFPFLCLSIYVFLLSWTSRKSWRGSSYDNLFCFIYILIFLYKMFLLILIFVTH